MQEVSGSIPLFSTNQEQNEHEVTIQMVGNAVSYTHLDVYKRQLQNVHCTVKEFHSKISFGLKKATLHTPEIHLLKHRKLR